MRHAAVRPLIRAMVLLSLAACHDAATSPPIQTPLKSGLVLSAPVMSAGVSPASAGSAGSGPVVFMSLVRGAAPAGIAATLRNVTTGLKVQAVPRDGGIDPVPVQANVGDSLAVTVSLPAGSLDFGAAVSASSAPAIVRTLPAANATSVPRNRAIVIVFSAPVAAASLASAIQLSHGGTAVPGATTFLDSSHVTVLFTPAALLDPDTPYRLVVTTSVTDLNGVPLDAPLDITFTTGQALLGPVASIAVYPANITVPIGQMVQFTALLTDAAGDTLVGPAPSWTTGNNAIATLSNIGVNLGIMVRGVAAGSTTITATSGGVHGTATVSVIASLASVSFTGLSVGSDHTCGVTTAGATYCWGGNGSGQLGSGGKIPSPYPTAVSGGLTAASAGSGFWRSCALTTAGAAWCWGDSSLTNLILGSGSLVPLQVPGAHVFQAMVVGGTHACGLTSVGQAWCWGSNTWGQLGDPTSGGDNTPRAVTGGLTFRTLSAGSAHTCGLAADSTAYCWGYNTLGGLGTGGTGAAFVPVPVQGGLHFATLASGYGHTCAATAAGAVYCWGANGRGQLGATSAQTCPGQADAVATDACSLTPLAVSGIPAVRALGAGYTHTCALTTAGAAYCWGENTYDQLGNGTTSDSHTPALVAGGLTFAKLSSGYYHSCGITTAGAAYCWGLGGSGELGDGATQSRSTPVRVAGQP